MKNKNYSVYTLLIKIFYKLSVFKHVLFKKFVSLKVNYTIFGFRVFYMESKNWKVGLLLI